MNIKERIEALYRYSGLTWRGLAEKIGVASSQTFTDIRSGKIGISTRVLNKIMTAFPEINAGWLMNDEGEMINAAKETPVAEKVAEPDTVKEENSEQVSSEKKVEGKGKNEKEAEKPVVPECKVDPMQWFPDAEQCVVVDEEAMVELPVGSKLILRKVTNPSTLVPGNLYLFETANGTFARRLGGFDFEYFTLHATNYATYNNGAPVFPSFDVPVVDVLRIHAVLGLVTVFEERVRNFK